jgi:transcriptional regulator with XRE-family HTH domain
MKFPQKLNRLMGLRRYSQSELAKAVRMSQATISKWATGERVPKAKQFLALAKTLEVDLEYLIDDSKSEPFVKMEVTDEEKAILGAVRVLGARTVLAKLKDEEMVESTERDDDEIVLDGRSPNQVETKRPPAARRRGGGKKRGA